MSQIEHPPLGTWVTNGEGFLYVNYIRDQSACRNGNYGLQGWYYRKGDLPTYLAIVAWPTSLWEEVTDEEELAMLTLKYLL